MSPTSKRAGPRLALVTGGSDGIGLAIAHALAADGMSLVLVALSDGRLDQAAKEIEKDHGIQVKAVGADLSTGAGVKEAADAARRVIAGYDGKLATLINNAGFGRFDPFPQVDVASFEFHFALNVRAPYFLTQALLAELTEARGSVVNISSHFAQKMNPTLPTSLYSATKGAVNSMTKALAYELGRAGVRVNAVAPGTTNTPLVKANLGKLTEQTRAGFDRYVQLHYPLYGRIGEPEQVAAAVTFLASPAASWITGVILNVDGGLTIT